MGLPSLLFFQFILCALRVLCGSFFPLPAFRRPLALLVEERAGAL